MDTCCVAFLLLCCSFALASANCDRSKEHFSSNGVTMSGLGDAGVQETVCSGAGSCCSARDMPSLNKFTEDKMKTYLHKALHHSSTTLRSLADDMDGAVCWALNGSFTQTDQLLGRTYSNYYVRNRQIIKEFFCSLWNIYDRCDSCIAQTEAMMTKFLERLLVRMLKMFLAVSNHISERYERCILQHVDIRETFDRSALVMFLRGLQKSICRTCLSKRALVESAHLVRQVKKPSMNAACKERLLCMHSCACCSGSSTCGQLPCHDCCTDALTPCIEPDFGALHEPYTCVVDQLKRDADEMLGKLYDPDHLLATIKTSMSEFIMNGYSKLDKIYKKTLKDKCGLIHAHLVQAREMPPAVPCPICQGSPREIKAVLTTMRSRLPGVRDTFGGLKETICAQQAAPAGGTGSCDSCSSCRNKTRPVESESAYLGHVVTMKTRLPVSNFYQQCRAGAPAPPRNTAPPARSGCKDIDDEDCARGSGSGSGSGDYSGDGDSTNQGIREPSGYPPTFNFFPTTAVRPTFFPQPTRQPATLDFGPPKTVKPIDPGTRDQQTFLPGSNPHVGGSSASRLTIGGLLVLLLTSLAIIF